MVGPMTEHCGFLSTSQKIRDFQKEFDALNEEFQYMIVKYIDPRGIPTPSVLPNDCKN
jgi:hypothetical protein